MQSAYTFIGVKNMYEQQIELMQKKKIEILKFIEQQFDVVITKGRGTDFAPYDVVDRKLMNEYAHVRWREDRTVWISVITRGLGISIRIKTEVKSWTGGRTTSDKEHYKEWGFPFGNEGYEFKVSHGNELMFAINESEVELFDPSSEYFFNYLKHTFELFQERLKISLENEKIDVETKYRLREEIARNEENEEIGFQGDIEKQILENKNDFIEKITFKRKPKQHKSESVVTKYSRSNEVAANALSFAQYKCEIDNNHVTFVSRRSGKSYVEAHHLIPISFSEEFNFSLDVEANIVSLCPNCHRKIHCGLEYEIKELIEILYFRRINQLNKCGLPIGMQQLYLWYLE